MWSKGQAQSARFIGSSVAIKAAAVAVEVIIVTGLFQAVRGRKTDYFGRVTKNQLGRQLPSLVIIIVFGVLS